MIYQCLELCSCFVVFTAMTKGQIQFWMLSWVPYLWITVLTIADPRRHHRQGPYRLASLFIDNLLELMKLKPTWTTKSSQRIFDVHRDSLEYIKIGELSICVTSPTRLLLLPAPSIAGAIGLTSVFNHAIFIIEKPRHALLASCTH